MSGQDESPIFVVMGATASGKSAFAVDLAESVGGVIINADTLQMYHDLRIVSARPLAQEMRKVSHLLYGSWHWREEGSVARWLDVVTPAIAQVLAEGKTPILCGGTGMYIQALMQGLSAIPAIPEAVRNRVAVMQQADPAGFHAQLAKVDPVMAVRLKPGDTQRLARAMEVVMATGQSLSIWQQELMPPPFATQRYRVLAMDMPREELYDRINRRFEVMMEAGAVEEVAALRYTMLRDTGAASYGELPADAARLPILKAHGLRHLWAVIEGRMALEAAIEKSQQETRNYAKRQLTWLRNQLPHAEWVSPDKGSQAPLRPESR